MFAMEPPKASASSPSFAESGERVQNAAVVSPVATPLTQTSPPPPFPSPPPTPPMGSGGLSQENSDPSVTPHSHVLQLSPRSSFMGLQNLKRLQMAAVYSVCMCVYRYFNVHTLVWMYVCACVCECVYVYVSVYV